MGDEDSNNFAHIDETFLRNETYFSHIRPLKPSRGFPLYSFKEYGPYFKVRLRVIVNSFEGPGGNNILQISDGCRAGRVQCRQPHLNFNNKKKQFKLYFSHDIATHGELGDHLDMPGVELNIPYDMIIEHEDGVLTWTVNSNVIGTIANGNQRVFVGMKVFVSSLFYEPFDGIVSNFEISAVKGKTFVYF